MLEEKSLALLDDDGVSSTSVPPSALGGVRSVLLSSRDRSGLDRLIAIAQTLPNIDISTNHLNNEHSDPLQGVDSLPDLLLFWIGDNWREELNALVQRPAAQRPPLIVVGDTSEPQAMRLAMKAGAADYLRPDFDAAELQVSIAEAVQRISAVDAEKPPCRVVSVVNAKGGAGGSFVASNLAYTLRASLGQQVALVDLDLQYGSLCHYLDMQPRYGITEVLQNIDGLDEAALKGYMLQHPSGLYLLEAKPGDPCHRYTISPESMDILVDVMDSFLNQVIFDVPGRIDSLGEAALLRSSKILLLLQQSMPQLRNARLLLRQLQNMGIDRNRIEVVVNRYDKRAELTSATIAKALDKDVEHFIPNAFAQVNSAINDGLPLIEAAGKSGVTRALQGICEGLVDAAEFDHKQSGLMGRVLKNLRRA